MGNSENKSDSEKQINSEKQIVDEKPAELAITPEVKPEPPQIVYECISFPGKIHLINSDQDLLAVAESLASVEEFGFDTETRPSFKKGEFYNVALLQLSTETDAYIFRLHYISQYQIIKTILQNPEVVKVGVAIRDDLKHLQKTFQFTPNNFVELQTLAKLKQLKNFGLKGMAEEVLHATISKGPKTTNWEAKKLTDVQLKYAATDAWIGLMLYRKLKSAE